MRWRSCSRRRYFFESSAARVRSDAWMSNRGPVMNEICTSDRLRRESKTARQFHLIAGLFFLATAPLAAQQPVYRDASKPVETRVHDLLGRMTLDEKFWQLFMIPGNLDDSTNDYRNGIFGLQVRGPQTARA